MRTHLIETKEYSRVIRYLQQNQPVVVPTETVYGLAGNAESDIACRNIFVLKNRPVDNPLIVHCSDVEMAQQYMCWNYTQGSEDLESVQDKQKMIDWYTCTYNKALTILRAFAPGPISVITFASQAVSTIARAGGQTVALRIPAHSVFKDIIAAFGKPLAAPSANVSGFPSPTNALMAWEAMSGRVSAIVDGGQCDVGLESTIVDCTVDSIGISLRHNAQHKERGNHSDAYQSDGDIYRNSVCIVRAGSINAHTIHEKTGLQVIDMVQHHQQKTKEVRTIDTSTLSERNTMYEDSSVSRIHTAPIIASVPGTKYRHYAPHAKVIPLDTIVFDNDDNSACSNTFSIKKDRKQGVEKIVYDSIIPFLQKDLVHQYHTIGLVLGPISQDMYQVLYNAIVDTRIIPSLSMVRLFSSWQELAQRLYEYFATSDRLQLDALFVCIPQYSCHSALYDRIMRASYS